MLIQPDHQDHYRSPASEFWAGCQAMVPLVIGAIPFGIIFGTLANTSGLSFGATLAMSAFVFAGSAQFIAISLLTAGASLPIIILTTLVVNLRHLLYSVSLVPHVQRLPPFWKLITGFWLTDESFAVAIERFNHQDTSPYKHWYYLGAALFMYGNWQLCTWVGLTLGRSIPDAANWGLDFAMAATFIGMVIPYVVTRSMFFAVLTASIFSILTYGLPHKLGLIVTAIVGITVGVLTEPKKSSSSPNHHE